MDGDSRMTRSYRGHEDGGVMEKQGSGAYRGDVSSGSDSYLRMYRLNYGSRI